MQYKLPLLFLMLLLFSIAKNFVKGKNISNLTSPVITDPP